MENTHKLSLDVDLNEDLFDITSSLVIEFMNLLMYFRGQIPSPTQILKRHIRDSFTQIDCKKSRVKLKAIKNQEKCQLCLKQFDEIKEQVNNCLKFCDNFEAVLIMGSTPVSVKEVYSIKVKPPKDFKSCSQKLPTAAKIQQYTNKLNLLLMQVSSSFKKELRCTKNILLIKGKRKLAGESLKPWENFKFLKKRHMMHLNIDLQAPSQYLQSPFHTNTLFNINQASKIKKRRSYSAFEVAELVSPTCNESCNAQFNEQGLPLPSNNILPSSRRHSLPMHWTTERSQDVEDPDIDVALSGDDTIWFEIPVAIRGFKF
uniref:Uncharacterized protein LOC100178824 n=1 Tax=Phallusia mammillata TaxID=59560 RepID=A0A6F9DG73_9ASCI|nr:uncharacterized protein LOC100178824 [Phallusia mammillata]